MSRIITVDPFSSFFPLRMIQKVYVFIIKCLVRVVAFPASASIYPVYRFLLEFLAFFFLPFPCRARRETVSFGNIEAEWICWKGFQGKRTILYLHGGGYSMGSSRTHRQMVAQICRHCNARGLIVRYRRAPEHSFPAALDDALASFEWLIDSGIDPSSIVVMGDSSGGGLSLALVQALRDRGRPLPRCVLCISPWSDLDCTGESMETRNCADPMLHRRVIRPFAMLYAPESLLRDPGVSPLYGSFESLPPLFLMVGNDEVLLDDSRRIVEKSESENFSVSCEVWKSMFHVWPIMYCYLPGGRKAFARMKIFIDSHMD